MKTSNSDIFEKLILVFYIDTRNMSPHSIAEYIAKVKENAMPADINDANKMLRYFVPIDGPSRVECLNPPGWCCCDRKRKGIMEKKLAETNDRLDRVLESMFPIKREVLVEKA